MPDSPATAGPTAVAASPRPSDESPEASLPRAVLLELHCRSVKFQRSLEELAADHAAQLADLGSHLSLEEGAAPEHPGPGGGEGRVAFGGGGADMPPAWSTQRSVSLGGFSRTRVASEPGNAQFTRGTSNVGLVAGRTSALTEPGDAGVEMHRYWAKWELGEESRNTLAAHDQYVSECGVGPRPTVHRSRISLERSQTLFMGRVFQDSHPASQLLVMRPGSVQHLTHALVCLCVIMYDIMSLPLVLAFQLEDLAALDFMDTLATLWWTWDFVNNFRTGYAETDHNELRLRKIASRYLRTWFMYDIFLVSFDWFTYVMRDWRGLGAARILKSPRIVRVLFRALRLLRVVKLTMVLEDVLSYITSEWLSCTVSVVKLLVGLVLFNHFVACFWYLIGDATASSIHGSWTDRLDRMDAPVSTGHRYLLSFHWSMCQYTPAPNDYHPINEWERFYACVILLFGIAVFSSFLGKITSLLTHMSAAAYERSKNERFMRRFLVGNMITLEVANRITTFLSKRQTKSQAVAYSEVANFVELPASLATELKKEAYCRCLQKHALIECLLTSDERAHSSFVFRLCIQGIKEQSMKWGDELLTQSGTATSMVFVKDGRLEYALKREFTDWANAAITVVGSNFPKKWACEMAVWCVWHCRGHLSARAPCIALVVDVEAFHQIAKRNVAVFELLQSYAEGYTQRLVRDLDDPDMAPTVNDLWGQDDDAKRLVVEVFDLTFGGDTPTSAGRRGSISSNGSLESVVAAGYRCLCRCFGQGPGAERSERRGERNVRASS